jgi:hypothetical protein
MRLGADNWHSNFAGAMKEWSVSFCEGSYRTEHFDNLFDKTLVSSLAFGAHEKD